MHWLVLIKYVVECSLLSIFLFFFLMDNYLAKEKSGNGILIIVRKLLSAESFHSGDIT